MNTASVFASPATCIICRVWCGTPGEKAFTRGEQLSADNVHSALVLGFFVGLRAGEIKGGVSFCSVHAQMMNEHELARDVGTLGRAIASGKDAGLMEAIAATTKKS